MVCVPPYSSARPGFPISSDFPPHLSALQDKTTRSPLTTPLSQEILTALANEISGQTAFNNEVRLAGAPWIRSREELKTRFLESTLIHSIVKEEYGISTTRIDRYDRDRTFSYPMEGELWIVEPEIKRLARLDADAALVASGSSSVDTTGGLIYLPPFNEKQLKDLESRAGTEPYKGKIALVWSFPRGRAAKLLDAAGLRGVISFNTPGPIFRSGPGRLFPRFLLRTRKTSNSVSPYPGGSGRNSWRMWKAAKTITLRCNTKFGEYPGQIRTCLLLDPRQ